MSDKELELLNNDELDVIGEVLNMSMGAAATAVSTMLDRQVYITTPRIEQDIFSNIDCSDLEPSLMVKIKYIQGIEGINVTLLKRSDIQVIIDILMGNEIVDYSNSDDEFEFDDMTMSAASEVMNQMMGASATTMSEILEIPINISTPEPSLVSSKADIDDSISEIKKDEPVVSVSFDFKVSDILNTRFICFLSIPLSRWIISTVNSKFEDPDELLKEIGEEKNIVEAKAEEVQAMTTEETPIMNAQNTQINESPPVQPAPPPVQQAPPPVQQAPPPVQQAPPPVQQAPPPVQQAPPPVQQAPPPVQQAPPPVQQAPPMPQNYAQQAPQMPMGYPQYAASPQNQFYPSVKNPAFPDFSQQGMIMPSDSNIGLLMGVKLDVSVIIGRTKQKIKDVVEFGQGTVIELDKQTGSPAEVIVNGQLLAYGDVIVVGDNFGIRITEIVGTKELLDSLENRN